MSTLTPSEVAETSAAWHTATGGLLLKVRLTPKGGRDAIEGTAALADGSVVLRARVRAAPEDGKANTALVHLIGEALGLPASTIAIKAGAASRTKTLFIAGDGPALARLAAATW